jgi:FG-GAP-like repeat
MPVETPFDYNGDNLSDVVWFNFGTDQHLIWHLANNQFVNQEFVAADLTPQFSVSFFQNFTPRSGDFNGDNTTDLFFFNLVTGQTFNYLFENDQVFDVVALPTVNPAAGWRPVADGDFNGNGISDVLWHNFNTDANIIWSFGSNGEFASQTILPSTTSNWFGEGSPLPGDYNNDGTTDLLWRDDTAGTNIIWNLSGGLFANQTVLPVATSNWELFGTGDFNADGTSDVLWHNFANDVNVIWQINNSQFVQQSNLPPTTFDWVARVGTYDSDATSEIFWHRQFNVTGENIVWNIQNLQFVNQTVNPSATNAVWTFPDTLSPFSFQIDI